MTPCPITNAGEAQSHSADGKHGLGELTWNYPVNPRFSHLFVQSQEERNYILQMVKKIRASGANVLLIQKSILRDAVTDLSLHYLVRRASRVHSWLLGVHQCSLHPARRSYRPVPALPGALGVAEVQVLPFWQGMLLRLQMATPLHAAASLASLIRW